MKLQLEFHQALNSTLKQLAPNTTALFAKCHIISVMCFPAAVVKFKCVEEIIGDAIEKFKYFRLTAKQCKTSAYDDILLLVRPIAMNSA